YVANHIYEPIVVHVETALITLLALFANSVVGGVTSLGSEGIRDHHDVVSHVVIVVVHVADRLNEHHDLHSIAKHSRENQSRIGAQSGQHGLPTGSVSGENQSSVSGATTKVTDR